MSARTFAAACALALAFGALARAQQPGPPDFVGHCQKAAGEKAKVDPATVKVRGKSPPQNGRVNVDFVLADGRHGVCRAKPDATIEEVKVEGMQ